MCTSPLTTLCSPDEAKLPTAIALGSFDGIHCGHQRVIETIAHDNTGIPTVVSFWPHPREVLSKETRLRIELPSEKTLLLGQLGIKQLVLIPFDIALSEYSPEKFFKEILIDKLDAKHIAVGNNFRFGKNRMGDTTILSQLSEEFGIKASVVPLLTDNKGRMSSSRIRQALNNGKLEDAYNLMGRAYKFKGRVIKGKGIGKTIGWPTANLEINGRKLLPKLGVYAALAWINQQNKALKAVMNLGPQPTVDPTSPSKVEVHLIAQNINLDNCEMTIQPIKRLRGQEKFKNLDLLKAQIQSDSKMALKILTEVNY